MYSLLLSAHSLLRWAVLIVLVWGIIVALMGQRGPSPFGKRENMIRVLAIIFVHLQVVIGIILYIISPIMKAFWADTGASMKNGQIRFFAVEHMFLMLIAAILITIGSSKIKKAITNSEKHKKMAVFFALTLLIIFIAIPWPFSPMAQRSYLYGF